MIHDLCPEFCVQNNAWFNALLSMSLKSQKLEHSCACAICLSSFVLFFTDLFVYHAPVFHACRMARDQEVVIPVSRMATDKTGVVENSYDFKERKFLLAFLIKDK